jgi:hypothetical protein
MAMSNEEELFTEASGELQSEVEDALESARESLPSQESLVVEEDAAVSEVVAGLPAELDPSEPAAALRTAQKRFALGEQADAFNEEFVAEATTAIEQVENAVDALQRVGDTAPTLAAALATLQGVYPETPTEQDAQTDAPTPEQEPMESSAADAAPGTDEEAPTTADAHSDEAQQTINEESTPTDPDTDDDGMSDDEDGPVGADAGSAE